MHKISVKLSFLFLFIGLTSVMAQAPTTAFTYQGKLNDGGAADVGFGAEDVARINPLFVTYNVQGEIEGVEFDRLSVAFVNAAKERQTKIQNQQEQINALKRLVCELKPEAAICKQ